MKLFYESLIKMSTTILLTFIPSIEREFRSHPGGITTHMLLGIGSCMFTILSIKIQQQNNEGDITRIAAQIVSGMGFLGSATVYKSDNFVKGINTAASLWVATAIGMAVGGDMWELGLLGSLFTTLILLFNNCYKKCIYNYKRKDSEDSQDDIFIADIN
jgi:putative Mg2+ transporter-C (MgtC) family protein|tara:strand:- start:4799 stop:5275 length:477 start_codon:yes stop_codon:yes gene_type:complete